MEMESGNNDNAAGAKHISRLSLPLSFSPIVSYTDFMSVCFPTLVIMSPSIR